MFFGKTGEKKEERKNEERPRKRLMVGFDLGDDACQMSYGFVGEEPSHGFAGEEPFPEPVTYATVPGRDVFDIPTVLGKKAGENTWYYGRDAVRQSGNPDVFFLPHLLSQALDSPSVVVEDQEYDPAALLAMFISRCLNELSGFLPGAGFRKDERDSSEGKQKHDGNGKKEKQGDDGHQYEKDARYHEMKDAGEAVNQDREAVNQSRKNPELSGSSGLSEESDRGNAVMAVMFTARVMDGRMIDLLENVRKRLDLSCPVYYQSYAGSFYDFMLSQEKSLREPGSVLFEYENGGKLRISKLFFNLHTTPIVAYQEAQEYPGLFASEETGRDSEFAKIIKNELSGSVFSSVYLIGDGFKGGWMKKSAAELCRGRRAFLGNNLFSKGAAYGAMYRTVKPAFLQNYFFLDRNKVRCNVLVRALNRGEADLVTLLNAGVNWYEVHQSSDLVLDGTGEIDLILKPLTGGEEEPFHIRLDRLPVREGRITRVRIHFDMPSVDKLHLLIEDLGFGEIFPSSGLRWEQVISV